MPPRPNIFLARGFAGPMPENLTPSARLIVMYLWLSEQTRGGATRAEVMEATAVEGRSFDRSWKLLHSRKLLTKAGA